MDEFGIKPRPASSKPKMPFRQKPLEKKPLAVPENDDLKTDRDKYIGSFEPSNIFNTRNSSFWRLRNLRAWFKEQESYEDPRYIKCYSVEN